MRREGPIDLEAVRASVARLEAIARAHPGLIADDEKDNCAAWEATLREIEERDEMARPPGPEPTAILAVRLGESLVEALDRYKDHLSAENQGILLSRNDAIRRLLILGLDHEGMAPKPLKPKAKPKKARRA